jgi:hypothetical protein
MGSRGTARVKKAAKKSKYSALEKMDMARVGAEQRRKNVTYPRTHIRGRTARRMSKLRMKRQGAVVRERFIRNPLPRANRSR